MQTSANQGEGVSETCKRLQQLQSNPSCLLRLSKTLQKLFLICLAKIQQFWIRSALLVGFSTDMHSYGKKKSQIQGVISQMITSQGGGCNGYKPNNLGGYCHFKPQANWRAEGVKNPEILQTQFMIIPLCI